MSISNYQSLKNIPVRHNLIKICTIDLSTLMPMLPTLFTLLLEGIRNYITKEFPGGFFCSCLVPKELIVQKAVQVLIDIIISNKRFEESGE